MMINDPSDPQTIKYTITRLLASREHSRHELLIKLQQRQFDTQTCIEWIEKFADADIQSDHRFAEMLLRSRVQKGQGELALRQECASHKLPEDLVQTLLDAMQIDWFEQALAVAQKKTKGQLLPSLKDQQKLYRFMAQRGFSSEQIRYAIQNIKQ
ncbi:MAG: regulatory protein RecX [Paraglaciecola sp.]|nr:regulatory protein RecX [Paraglaciecola sp.]NCT46619.1 regulatory protein RecX [Paraglaciecola sp.]